MNISLVLWGLQQRFQNVLHVESGTDSDKFGSLPVMQSVQSADAWRTHGGSSVYRHIFVLEDFGYAIPMVIFVLFSN